MQGYPLSIQLCMRYFQRKRYTIATTLHSSGLTPVQLSDGSWSIHWTFSRRRCEYRDLSERQCAMDALARVHKDVMRLGYNTRLTYSGSYWYVTVREA